MREVKRVSVIGSGIMGSGIARVAAESGFEVTLMDSSEEALKRALSTIERGLHKAVEKGLIAQEKVAEAMKRIGTTSSLQEASVNTDFVIEAVVEKVEVKKEIFSQLDQWTKPDVILATNTSQIPITQVGSSVKDPSRVVGMHWFNPPVQMKLIEVIEGLLTSKEVLKATFDLALAFGKEPIFVKDRQGFLVNRALGVFLAECFRMLDEGVSTAEEIDKAIKLGLGHPMGPFELADMIGLDTILNTSEQMHKVYGERRLPPQILRLMVAAGRFGRKSGAGFYDYTKKA